MRNNLKKSKKKGFTLVELIAVIAILAILAAIIVPRVTSLSATAKERAARADARTILSQLEVYNATVTDSTKTILDTATLTGISAASIACDTTLDAYTQLKSSIDAAVKKSETIKASDGTTVSIANGTTIASLRTAVATQ